MTAIETVYVQLGLQTDGLRQGLKEAQTELDTFGAGLEKIGIGLTAAFTAPLALLAKFSLDAQTEFAAAMNKVNALVDDISREQLNSLEKLAIQLGKDTIFSAKQAAEAMGEFAAAGFKAEQIAAAMPGALSLAAVSQMSLADSTRIAVGTLGGFQIAAEKMGHVSDVLAKAASMSAVELKDIGYTMKYVAPVAQSLGVDMETVAAATVAMGNQFIRGEQAGTGLRAAMLRLAAPTKENIANLKSLGIEFFNSNGKAKDFIEIIDALNKQHVGAAKAAKLFGIESTTAMLALLNTGGPALRQIREQLYESTGAADAMAAKMREGLPGAIEKFRGSVETLTIAIGKDLQPVALTFLGLGTDLLNWATGAAEAFGTLPGPLQAILGVMAALAATIGPATIALSYFMQTLAGGGALYKTIVTLGSLPGIISTVAFAFQNGLTGALIGTEAVLASIVTVLGTLAAAIGGVVAAVTLVTSVWDAYNGESTAALEKLSNVTKAWNDYGQVAKEKSVDVKNAFYDEVEVMQIWASKSGLVFQNMTDLERAYKERNRGFWDDLIDLARNGYSVISGFLAQLTGEYDRNLKAMNALAPKVGWQKVTENFNKLGQSLLNANPGANNATAALVDQIRTNNRMLEELAQKGKAISKMQDEDLASWSARLKKHYDSIIGHYTGFVSRKKGGLSAEEREAKRQKELFDKVNADFDAFITNLSIRQTKAAKSPISIKPSLLEFQDNMAAWKVEVAKWEAANARIAQSMEETRKALKESGKDIKFSNLINSGEWFKETDSINKKIEELTKKLMTLSEADKFLAPGIKRQITALEDLRAGYNKVTSALMPEVMQQWFETATKGINPLTGQLLQAGEAAGKTASNVKDIGKNSQGVQDIFKQATATLQAATAETDKMRGSHIKTTYELEKQLQLMEEEQTRRKAMGEDFTAQLEREFNMEKIKLEILMRAEVLDKAAIEKQKEKVNGLSKELNLHGVNAKMTDDAQKRQKEFYQEMRGVYNSMINQMSEAIASGRSMGEVFSSVFKSIKVAFVKLILHETFDGMKRSFLDALKDGDTFHKSMVTMAQSIGAAFKKLFSIFDSGASAMKNTAGAINTGMEAGKNGGAAANALGKLGGGGLMGPIGAISSAVSAIFDALGFFQGRRMEKDIGRIEVTSREIKADQQNIIGIYNKWLPFLEQLALLSTVHADLMMINANLEFAIQNGGFGGGNGPWSDGQTKQSYLDVHAKVMEDIRNMIKQQGAIGQSQQDVADALKALNDLSNLKNLNAADQAAYISRAVSALQKIQGGSLTGEQLLAALGLKASFEQATEAQGANSAALEVSTGAYKVNVDLTNRVNDSAENASSSLTGLGESAANTTSVTEAVAKNMEDLSKTLFNANEEQRKAMLAGLSVAELSKLKEYNTKNLTELQDAFKKAAENTSTSAEELQKFVFAVRDAQKGIWETNQRWREEMEKQTGQKISVAGGGNNAVTDPNMISEYIRKQIDGLVAGKITMSVEELKALRLRAKQYGVVTDELDRLISSVEGLQGAAGGGGGVTGGGATGALEGAAGSAKQAEVSFGETATAANGLSAALNESTSAVQSNVQATLGAMQAMNEGSAAWALQNEAVLQDVDALRALYVQNPTQDILEKLNTALAAAASKQSNYNPPGFMQTGGVQTYGGNVMAWEPLPGAYGPGGNQLSITINANNASQGRQLANSFVDGLRERGVEI